VSFRNCRRPDDAVGAKRRCKDDSLQGTRAACREDGASGASRSKSGWTCGHDPAWLLSLGRAHHPRSRSACQAPLVALLVAQPPEVPPPTERLCWPLLPNKTRWAVWKPAHARTSQRRTECRLHRPGHRCVGGNSMHVYPSHSLVSCSRTVSRKQAPDCAEARPRAAGIGAATPPRKTFRQ
jgi:hypothetical protein